MAPLADVNLSKFFVNPSKSVTFTPSEKKQQVVVEVTNNCTTPVAVKWKNTQPQFLKTKPAQSLVAPGEKVTFKCMFGGSNRNGTVLAPKTNDRFTIVLFAVPKNANLDKVREMAHKTATRKMKIAVLWAGVNDQKEKETQQPTNLEEEEDKDRQGTMRTKPKTEMKPPANKKAMVMMFTRKEGESLSDEDEDKEEGTGANEDMMTTRPAGAFNGQVAANAAGAAAGAPTDPKSELKTTKPAGAFKGQTAANAASAAVPGAPVDPKSELKTTKPAGAFNGQVAANPVPGAPVDPKSDLKTTKPAGTFNGQTAANATPTASPNPDMKTTKAAGEFNNEQQPNR